MHHKAFEPKILNPEEFVDFKYKNENCDAKLVIQIGYAPKTITEELPITFGLRYRIFFNKVHVSTFMVDYKFKIWFDHPEEPTAEIYELIQNMILDLLGKFTEMSKAKTQTANQILSGKYLGFIMRFVDDIIKKCQSQGLIP